jgi:hypothetical protein
MTIPVDRPSACEDLAVSNASIKHRENNIAIGMFKRYVASFLSAEIYRP